MHVIYRLIETEKDDFERELRLYGADGWIPMFETKQTVVVREQREQLDNGRVCYEEAVIHSMVMQKIRKPEE